MKTKNFFILILILITLITNIRKNFAQETDTLDIFKYTLSDLMNIQVKNTSNNYSMFMPYIMETITKEDIITSGASDLMEVLRKISGIDFGTDVNGQVGIISNGIWGHEGKVLLLIDGKIMNEFMYGSLQFGYHYPIENIKKIEIIKGASSVLIGAFSELMVINIITSNPKETKGLYTGIKTSIHTRKPLFYQNYYLNYNKEISKNLYIQGFARYSKGYRSDKEYYDIYGNNFNLMQNQLNDLHFNFKLRYRNIEIGQIYDKYNTTTRDNFSKILSQPYPKNFTLSTTNLTYNFRRYQKLSGKFIINYQFAKPWEAPIDRKNPIDSQYYQVLQDIHTFYPKIIFTYHFKPKIKYTIGVNILANLAIDNSPYATSNFWNGQKKAYLITYGQFSQMYYKNPQIALTIGERLEYNPIYGVTFLPRIALIKEYQNNIIFKISFDKSFRTPTIANLTYNYPLFLEGKFPLIKPEISNYLNSQLKFVFNNSEIYINGFFIKSNNAISYFVYKDGTEGYANIAQLSTYGLNITFKKNYGKLYTKYDLSLQQAIEYDSLQIYHVNEKNTYLGTSWFKGYINLKYKINRSITFNNDFLIIGPKYGYYQFNNQTSTLNYKEFPWTFIITSNLTINLKKFNFNIGIYNILDQKDYLIQPYNGWHAPLLNKGRLFRFALAYKF